MFELLEKSQVFWRSTVVGSIQNVGYDFPRFYGDFIPGPEIERFYDLFRFLMDVDAVGDPSFSSDLLDDENWWIVQENGERAGIFVPAIDLVDLSIEWRDR